MTNAKQIAAAINAAGKTHFGDSAKGWESGSVSRIYFGRDFVTIEASGEIHNRKSGNGRANTIGDSAVVLVKEFAQ